MIVYAILALRRFLVLSNQHHFNERGDRTDKTKSTLTVCTGIGLFSISKIPFENLALLSVLLLVALVILDCSILFVIVSNKRTRNLKNLIVAPIDAFLERITTKNKALPSKKKHH